MAAAPVPDLIPRPSEGCCTEKERKKKQSVNIIHHYPPQQTLSGDPAEENLDKNKVVGFFLQPGYFTCWSLPWWADLRWRRSRPTFDTHPAEKLQIKT